MKNNSKIITNDIVRLIWIIDWDLTINLIKSSRIDESSFLVYPSITIKMSYIIYKSFEKNDLVSKGFQLPIIDSAFRKS
jgi:hypothetical protein